jgi:hypothetical protein
MGGVNDVGLDGEIIIDEIGRISVIGVDAADFRRGEDDRIRAILLQPDFHGDLITEVDHGTVHFEDGLSSRLEMPGHGGADHAFMSGDPNSARARHI